MKHNISTDNAPAAIGSYSQAVSVHGMLYISGQIPLDPKTMTIVSDDFAEQTKQVFKNLSAIAEAAGGSLGSAIKLTVYLKDLDNFKTLNEVMTECMAEPYPARAAVEVSRLPKDVQIEIDAILAID